MAPATMNFFTPYMQAGIAYTFLDSAQRIAEKQLATHGQQQEKEFEDALFGLLGGDAPAAIKVTAALHQLKYLEAPPPPGILPNWIAEKKFNDKQMREIFDGTYSIVSADDNAITIAIRSRKYTDAATSAINGMLTGFPNIVIHTALAAPDVILSAHYKIFHNDKTLLKTMLRNLENINNHEYPDNAFSDILIEILARAAYSGASDAMLDINDKTGLIKFKIDGIASIEAETDAKILNGVIAVMAMFASVGTDKFDKPFESMLDFNAINTARSDNLVNKAITSAQKKLSAYRFRIQFSKPRMRTAPTAINVVIRILQKNATNMSMDSLGYSPQAVSVLRQVTKRQGLIVFAGATGSGKSTSGDALLREINPIQNWVVSVENPVEFPHKLFVQYEPPRREDVDIDIEYLNIIKSFLRSAPDVCFFGECREENIAQRLVELALTDSLVISTVHAGSVFKTFHRFHQWNVSIERLVDVLQLIVAQRLIPQICPSCKNDPQKSFQCLICGGRGFYGLRLAYEILYFPDDDDQRSKIAAAANTSAAALNPLLLEGKTISQRIKEASNDE